MKVSAKVDYACRALIELSLHWPNKEPLQIGEIAKRQQIPMKFLTQILLGLKHLGFVSSTRGKSGGYVLSSAPRDIRLSDLIAGLGDFGYKAIDPNNKSDNVMDAVWMDINDTIFESMNKINFHIIAERARSKEHIMMLGI